MQGLSIESQSAGQPSQVTMELVCAGSATEMGIAQGAAQKAKIGAAREALADLEAFRLQQPKMLPYGIYRWVCERQADKFLKSALRKDNPAMLERLQGIADGSASRVSTICLFNALEPLLSSVGGCTACPGACSAIAVRGRRSVTGEAIIARNFDYLPLVQPFYLLRESRPQSGLRSIEFTTAPLAGAVDGINEAGLCITYNYAFTEDAPKHPAAPISMAICDALRQCRNVKQAAEKLGATKRWGGGLLMLADATGEIASLELSSGRHYLRLPGDGTDLIYHANAFSSQPLREVQIADEAVYTERAPRPLRGRRLHNSSEQRQQRLGCLLAGDKPLDQDDLAGIMSDHGANKKASADTLCMHSDYWNTTACLQFFPKQRRMRVAYSSACQAEYQEFLL